ncbi:GAF and ANTAR domain-containing protein [Streptomyces sp. NP160]|uniref:GAF and ANTAR domain-containing protein n=1 Tax=Streptomyces sp. NP160 TaxID=2586637 RepID=UPI001C5A0046|nr:GAF and ANTAR domain-containing protein [Streptomyces sp. NP160]
MPASGDGTEQPREISGRLASGGAAGVETLSSEVVDAFVTLADSLVADYDPIDLLTHLAERAVHLLGVTAAGILLADPHSKTPSTLQLAAASSQEVADLELFQLSVEDGPCLQCYATGLPVVAAGVRAVHRCWPAFAGAMEAQGLRSVVAVPLRLRGQVLGALGMFSTAESALTLAATRVAQGLADVATIALLTDRAAADSRALTRQLQGALDSRVLIEQAKGVVASQLGTTIADAFLVLRSTARRRGVRLVDLCQALVEGRADATQLDV